MNLTSETHISCRIGAHLLVRLHFPLCPPSFFSLVPHSAFFQGLWLTTVPPSSSLVEHCSLSLGEDFWVIPLWSEKTSLPHKSYLVTSSPPARCSHHSSHFTFLLYLIVFLLCLESTTWTETGLSFVYWCISSAWELAWRGLVVHAHQLSTLGGWGRRLRQEDCKVEPSQSKSYLRKITDKNVVEI